MILEGQSAPSRPGKSLMATAFKEAGLTAILVLALAVGLVGFRVTDVPGGVDIRGRFDEVLGAVAVAALGRVAIVLLRFGRDLPVALGAAAAGVAVLFLLSSAGLSRLLPFDGVGLNALVAVLAFCFAGFALWKNLAAKGRGIAAVAALGRRAAGGVRLLIPLLVVLAILLPFFPEVDRRHLDVATLVVTYIMLGWGLNIVVGLAGLLDLGYVAFYAVGAYSYALLALHFDLGFWLCLPFAGIMAAFAGILLGFPVLRLRGDYLAIVTLGFGEMVRIILINWYQLTRGPNGLSGIPRPTFFGLPFAASAPEGTVTFHSFFGLTYRSIDRIVFLYYIVLALALLTNLFTLRIRRLPVGRAWEALREDEIASRALGIDPTMTKLTAFAIGAMFAGFAGAFFATRQGFVSPESFTFIESAVIVAIVVLGGMGTQIGVVLAAILLIGLPEVFRELQEFRMVAFGAAMVLIMVWRPAGLLAHRQPTILLPKAPAPSP